MRKLRCDESTAILSTFAPPEYGRILAAPTQVHIQPQLHAPTQPHLHWQAPPHRHPTVVLDSTEGETETAAMLCSCEGT